MHQHFQRSRLDRNLAHGAGTVGHFRPWRNTDTEGSSLGKRRDLYGLLTCLSPYEMRLRANARAQFSRKQASICDIRQRQVYSRLLALHAVVALT